MKLGICLKIAVTQTFVYTCAQHCDFVKTVIVHISRNTNGSDYILMYVYKWLYVYLLYIIYL